jgi:hypothetical protein
MCRSSRRLCGGRKGARLIATQALGGRLDGVSQHRCLLFGWSLAPSLENKRNARAQRPRALLLKLFFDDSRRNTGFSLPPQKATKKTKT